MEEEKVEVKVQEDEVEDGRDIWRVRREGRREIKHSGAWHKDEMTRTNTWANVVWDNIMSADKHEKKGDVWGCTVYTPRRLQQIAINGKLSCYNKIQN